MFLCILKCLASHVLYFSSHMNYLNRCIYLPGFNRNKPMAASSAWFDKPRGFKRWFSTQVSFSGCWTGLEKLEVKNASSDFPWRPASVYRYAALLTEKIFNSFDLCGVCTVSFCQKVYVEELWERAEDNTHVLQPAWGLQSTPYLLGLLFPSLDHQHQLLQVYGDLSSEKANHCWSGSNINISYCRWLINKSFEITKLIRQFIWQISIWSALSEPLWPARHSAKNPWNL